MHDAPGEGLDDLLIPGQYEVLIEPGRHQGSGILLVLHRTCRCLHVVIEGTHASMERGISSS